MTSTLFRLTDEERSVVQYGSMPFELAAEVSEFLPASLPDQDLSAYRAVAKEYAQLVPNERLREERGRACFAQRKKRAKKQRKTPPPGMSVHYSGFIGPYFYKSTGSIFDGWWESCGFTFSSVQDLFHDCWTPSFT
ncbi:unnamed protein product [Cladocopium goreaui]|uniref:Uncharacterized protein n=1 Tax=Cladocopium goreaui TaxID=2562237 RepID=A0A9P1GR59_9DINO|nr:unnamed protein product [Cladocopium goreaui]